MVCLIRDIDEKEGDQIIQLIIANGCSSHIKSLLHSLGQFSQVDFIKYKVNNIEVLENKEIASKCEVEPYIAKWLDNIPKEDITELVRILIVNPSDIDASGTYTPMLCKITLAWDNTFKPDSLFFRLFLLSTEHTFYHEIGHHIFRHAFGQDPTQEKEADKYASQVMTKAHPHIGRFLKVLRVIGIGGGNKRIAQQVNQGDGE